jgi:cytochrome c oxidase assembly protein subunit 15
VAQIALGGWLVASHAAFACPDFPTCRGQWWPSARFSAGFAAGFGGLAEPGAALSRDALVAIHLAHRVGALLALLVVGWAGWRALRSHGAQGLGAALLAALAAQWALGVAGVVAGLPLALAVAHHALAAVLLATAVVLHFRAYRAQFWI